VNQRQRGDLTWAHDLNALRTCCIQSDVDVALSRLSSRLAAGVRGPGPDVSVEPWADAVHVFAVNAQVDAHNNYRLQVLEGRGEVVYTIHATHAELLPNGLVSADPVP